MKSGIVIAALLLFCCCSKKQVSPPDTDGGRGYFPLKEGRFSVFEADSVVYTDNPKDTLRFRYLIKEVLTDQFTDAAGDLAWRFERFIKKYDASTAYEAMPWQVKDVWVVRSGISNIQVVEENVTFTKLSFPVGEGKQWDGNAGNTMDESIYYYSFVDKPLKVGQKNYEKVLQVNQKEFRTLISYDYQREIYAYGVGMVYREYRELYSNNIVPAQAVEQRIEKGVIFSLTLIAHGFEE